MALPRLMVAPNGARKQKSDHPALPITLDEMVTCAKDCAAAGADGLHLHLRDEDGGHLLDAAGYRAAIAAINKAAQELAVQITTEAVGIYDPDTQIEVALNCNASAISASVRELCRDGLPKARSFYDTCAKRGIEVQHILYDTADGDLLQEVLDDAGFRDPALQVLFVLGRYAEGQQSSPDELDAFLDWMVAQGISPDWALCAFGRMETDCLVAAARKGGKCRVGFENSFQNADGSIATDNAERVAEVHRELEKI